jgi:hypothetical protein
MAKFKLFKVQDMNSLVVIKSEIWASSGKRTQLAKSCVIFPYSTVTFVAS